MEMKKQYRALVKHRDFNKGQWVLAIPNERVYKTFEDAQDAIQQAIENGKPHYITAHSEKKGYYRELYTALEIVETKIESRLVTDWVEE